MWRQKRQTALPGLSFAFVGFLPSHCVPCELVYTAQSQNRDHNPPHFPMKKYKNNHFEIFIYYYSGLISKVSDNSANNNYKGSKEEENSFFYNMN